MTAPNSVEPRHRVLKRWGVWDRYRHRWALGYWGCPDPMSRTAAAEYARKHAGWIAVPIEVHVPKVIT